jgi:hypothetical protein
MTAEEFLKERQWKNGMNLRERIHESMIAFAKYHVEQALKEASNKSYTETIHTGRQFGMQSRVNKNSILNSYPLENIK